MINTIRMNVRVLDLPLDNFADCTVSICDWISRFSEDDNLLCPEDGPEQQMWKFVSALSAVSAHDSWEEPMRDLPRVGYDCQTDSPYFIFKIDNDGRTFIVKEEH